MSDTPPAPLPTGTRVRHIGEQYPEALREGTGNVVSVVRYYPQDRTYEYLVQCDNPPIWAVDGQTLVERNHVVQVHPFGAFA